MYRKFLETAEASSSATTRATAAAATPRAIGMRPLAKGRRRLRGCARSLSRSHRSLKTYVGEAANGKEKKATTVAPSSDTSKKGNAGRGGTNSSSFFGHGGTRRARAHAASPPLSAANSRSTVTSLRIESATPV